MKKNITISALTLLTLLSTGSAFADRVRAGEGKGDQGNGGCSCPNPVNIHIVKNSGATSGVQADYPSNFTANQMTYNDPKVDAHFTDTISWDLPKGACQITSGTVTWKVKNMASNGIQDNDTTGLWFKGAQLTGSGHPIPLAPNEIKSFSYSLSAAQIKNGRVSLAVQDDTAVMEFAVDIQGCCINPDAETRPMPNAGSGRG